VLTLRFIRDVIGHLTRFARPPARNGWIVFLCFIGACTAPQGATAREHSSTRFRHGLIVGARNGGEVRSRDKSLRIVHFDVGQGDATLVTTPEGKHMLIDGGPASDQVADLLWDIGVDTIDLVVSSHNHADHIGGLPEVFYSFTVRAYLENGIPATTAVYARLLSRVEQEPGVVVLRPTARTIRLGTVTVLVLPPSGVDRSHNNNSVGIEVNYGSFRELLTGDSEQAALSHWLAEGRAHPLTVIKVAHHGSWNGSISAWVKATHPAIAIISVGAGNEYGHPASNVERMWAAEGRVYRTDRDGTVTITAMPDGKYTVQTRRPTPLGSLHQ